MSNPYDPPEPQPSKRRTQAPYALRQLDHAFQKADGALSAAWVSDGDPDLDSLRTENSRDWHLVGRRHEEPADASPEQASPEEYGFHEPALHGYPERPWGDPERRRDGWVIVATAAVGLATASIVAWTVEGVRGTWIEMATALAIATAVTAVWRAGFAEAEGRKLREADGATLPATPPEPDPPEEVRRRRVGA